MLLVVGATGILGSEICRRLATAGVEVRALVRSTADATRRAKLTEWGLQLVEGDLKDRSSLEAACSGVTAVISTAASLPNRQQGDSIEQTDHWGQVNLIDAAVAAGAEQFVYVSVSGNGDARGNPFVAAKRAVEGHLQASGLAHTILRPSLFREMWLSPIMGFDYRNGTARVLGDGTRPVSYVSLFDVAAFAVLALTHPMAHNAIIEVGGPESKTPLEIIQLFEQATGRPFTVDHVPEAVLRDQVAMATDPYEKSLAALALFIAGGDAIDMHETLRQFQIQMSSVADYVSMAQPMFA
jgi:uncharacterized protein YbjT (DUF2867 family)